MEEADTVVLHNNNMVVILSKATRSKVILNKATSKDTAVVPDMVEDMVVVVVVDTEVAINSNLLRSLVVSVPEVPQPWVLVVV
jgi:hypothetical protein